MQQTDVRDLLYEDVNAEQAHKGVFSSTWISFLPPSPVIMILHILLSSPINYLSLIISKCFRNYALHTSWNSYLSFQVKVPIHECTVSFSSEAPLLCLLSFPALKKHCEQIDETSILHEGPLRNSAHQHPDIQISHQSSRSRGRCQNEYEWNKLYFHFNPIFFLHSLFFLHFLGCI